ncbi:MAG: S8 family serine peptidase, partial [Hyphomicrobiales bacterium]|nr:S8 family serine peptidase [Hyphomicrobiales bacterium]
IAGVAAPVSLQAAYFENAPKEADVYNYSHSSVTMVKSNDLSSDYAKEIQKSDNPFYRIAKAIEKMGTPFISSAGNSGKDGEVLPRFPAALPLFFPNLRGQVLAVTATKDDGQRASYANGCGELPSDWDAAQHGRHYCLAAPGGDEGSGFLVAGRKEDDESLVSGGGQNDEYDRAIGTSLSAPVVTGAFAIVKEWFRNNVNGRQIILRLVNTADNEDRRGEGGGDYSDVVFYGAGLLDLDAAISPVGNTSVSAAGNMNDGIVYDFDATSLSVSAAFGDALQRALQTREIAAFDELGAPFWHPLASLTATISNRETLRKRQARLLERDDAPVETAFGGRLALASTRTGPSEQIDMSLRQPVDSIAQTELLLTAGDLSTAPLGLHDDKSFAHPYLHFAGEGVGLGGSLQLGAGRLAAMGFTSGSASVSRDIPVEARGGLIEYALEPFAGVELGVQAGAMMEESRALGLLPEGGFGALGESSTAFAGVSLDGSLEDSWRFRASMLFGRTNLDTPPVGLLATSSSLASSAFRFALEGSDVLLDADRMDVFVAQPLRIEGGEADFVIPVARTPAGSITRERISGVSLEPGGRELEFGARYEMQVREDVIATGGVGIVHEGGHSKRQETEFYGLANLRIDF